MDSPTRNRYFYSFVPPVWSRVPFGCFWGAFRTAPVLASDRLLSDCFQKLQFRSRSVQIGANFCSQAQQSKDQLPRLSTETGSDFGMPDAESLLLFVCAPSLVVDAFRMLSGCVSDASRSRFGPSLTGLLPEVAILLEECSHRSQFLLTRTNLGKSSTAPVNEHRV